MMLSILTVSFNNSSGLRKTLQSVSSQTYKDYEEIVIDGGSNDNSIDVLKSFEGKISGYQWISEPDNGIYEAMNKGIEMATGEYCLFLNAGDMLEDDSVLDVLFKNDVTADIVSCNAIFEKSKFHTEKLIISPSEVNAGKLILSFLPHQATLIRRALFTDIHLYDTSFRIVSDWLFFIEAILKYNASYQHVQLFLARCETEGISSNPKNNALMDSEFHNGLKKVLPLYYDDYVALRKLRLNGDYDNNRQIRVIRKLLKKIGYYQIKASLKHKIFYKKLQKEDNRRKKLIVREIETFPADMLTRSNDASDFIVSLTSYGKRLANSAPYAIYSIFKQSKLPNRIVLWLDKDTWNDDNLPYLLKRLKKSGLEVRYCKDIKSYKKLIPSLKAFPDNPIITIDDDFYYNTDFVRWMTDSYQSSDKKTVFATWGCIPEKRGGKFIPYSQWRDCKYGNDKSEYSLFGGGGALYPPHIFDNELFREDLFMKLSPTADDIWFWIQELRLGIKTKMTEQHGFGLHRSINRIADYSLVDTLFLKNGIGGKNDEQLQAVLDHYNLQ